MRFWKGSPLARFGVMAALVAADQWSKSAVIAALGAPGEGGIHSKSVLGDWLYLSTSFNWGAAFGQFHQFPRVLVLGRAVAVLFLSWLLLRAESRPRLPLCAMTLVLAGALGNLIDNLWTGGAPAQPFLGVRDFIDVDFQPLFGITWHFPAFNLADSCITIGACAWILAGFLHKPAELAKPEHAVQPDEV